MDAPKYIEPIRLDIGSSTDDIEGYQSVDLFVDGADFKDDIRTMATFPDNIVTEVRTFHLLEHLAEPDVLPAMRSVYRILKVGGFWKIEVPDLIWVLNDFLETPENGRWGWKLQTLFGLQSHDGEFHKTGFSVERLGSLLRSVGFGRVRVDPVFSEKYNQGVLDAVAYKI